MSIINLFSLLSQALTKPTHVNLGVLASFCRRQADDDRIFPIRGPYRSLKRLGAVQRDEAEPVRFPVDEVMTWTDDASLPLLPTEESADVFKQLRKSPRLDLPMDLNNPEQLRARPYTELHATNDKKRMDFPERCPEGYWLVYKGESFDIWEPDRGESHYYAWVDPEEMIPLCNRKGKGQAETVDRRSLSSKAMRLTWMIRKLCHVSIHGLLFRM